MNSQRSQGNQRPPMLSIQNKSENTGLSKIKNKLVDQNVMFVDDNKSNTVNNLSSFKNYSLSEKTSSNTAEANEKKFADGEFIKQLQKALQEAINENEDLRDKINLLVKENSELKEEIEDKNFALLELAQFYEFCQKNHKSVPQVEGESEGKKIRAKRKSKSL